MENPKDAHGSDDGDRFLQHFNAFVCVLDPDLHTFQYVQERSSALLTVMLAASAKAFNPGLYVALQNHAEKLLMESFSKGIKTPEIVQAFVLNTYWKQPDDTRSWSLIGYSIRLCMDLGWHKLSVMHETDISSASELEKRQRRNIQRTWLVLFVYDRR